MRVQSIEESSLVSTYLNLGLAMRRLKRGTVQLTSLLDLLFVMIFISLMQTKIVPPVIEVPPVVVEEKKTEQAKPRPTKVPATAIFHFYAPASNPRVPTGTYAMEGTFDAKDGSLRLGGVSWINRPAGYDMVPLSGVISSDGATFTGRIEFQGCEVFTLRRTSQLSHSFIAGKWEGSYFCTQGETALTLTIQ